MDWRSPSTCWRSASEATTAVACLPTTLRSTTSALTRGITLLQRYNPRRGRSRYIWMACWWPSGQLRPIGASGIVALRIGRDGFAGAFWRGKLDDVRLWNVARTADQIQAGYLTQLAGSQSGLVANWQFDESNRDGHS
jgi:Concanavalin A-like lectin/glucanases superfamily